MIALWTAAWAHVAWPAGLALAPDGADWTVTWRVPDAVAAAWQVRWPDTCEPLGPPRRGRDDDHGLQVVTWRVRCPTPPELRVDGPTLDDPPVVLRTPSGVRLLSARPTRPGATPGWHIAAAILAAWFLAALRLRTRR